ncbi:MAG: oligosaccharide flippase family protein [Roseivirga sp.]|nr:oligosaccharide flippase family protein [Roseivirga sp.]
MGIVIRQSIRSSAIAYLGVVVGYINLLWLYPYFLSSGQIGLLRLIQSSAFILATFGQFGIPQITVKYFPELKHQRGFLSFILISGVIGFILLSTLSMLFQEPLIDYFSKESELFVQYFQVTLLITLFLIQFQILEAYSRSNLKIVIPTAIRDIQLRLATTTLVLLYGTEVISFDWMIKALVLLYISLVISLSIYLVSIKAFSLNISFDFLRGGLFKKLMRYGLYSLLGAGGTQIVLQIDSVMVSAAMGLEATGVYTIAFFIGVVIEMPRRSITQITAPLISQAFQKNDMEHVLTLYRQTSINQLIIGSLLLIGVWSNLTSIYQFIPNNEVYIAGMNVVLFIGLGKLTDMFFGVNGEIIVMSRYYRFNVIAVSILAILTIGLNYLLIPSYGIEGAAIASLMAMAIFNLSKFAFVWIKFGIQPFTLSSLKFVLIASLSLLANHFLPSIEEVLVDIVLRSAIITLIIMLPTYWLKISPEMNGVIDSLIKRLLKRKT